MKAMQLQRTWNISENPEPLQEVEVPLPQPSPGEILVRVSACGVCHTELDEIEDRTPPPRFPMILGHQIVGYVVESNSQTSVFSVGERVGIGWIHSACEKCSYCSSGNENLCPSFRATGRDENGGYAEFMTVPEAFAYRIPETFSDAEAAPLLCAGAIGYRSLRLTGMQDGQYLGLTGFGASAHIILMLVKRLFPHSSIYVFSRSESEQIFARELGAAWAGDFTESPPKDLNCIIDTTPVWKPVIESLRHLAPGGRLVINAIRKEELDKDYLLKLDYPTHLWMEKEIKSVANVSRRDVREFLQLAANIPIRPEYQLFDLDHANQALLELKNRKIRGAKVLKIGKGS